MTQVAVLVAGVGFNILFAWILFSIILMAGMSASVEGERWFGDVRDPALTIVGVVAESPAAAAGLAPGDVVLGLRSSGAELVPTTPQDLALFVGEHADEEITLAYRRGGEPLEAELSAAGNVIDAEPSRAALGVATGEVGILQLPPHLAILEAARMTIDMTGAVALGIGGFIVDAFTFSADFSQVAGPVGIVGLVGDVSALGVVPLLTFTAFISINLAIINLLPFPALDGGRLLFVAIEAVKGSRIRPEVANALNTIGFVLLLLLMVAVTYSDILRIVA